MPIGILVWIDLLIIALVLLVVNTGVRTEPMGAADSIHVLALLFTFTALWQIFSWRIWIESLLMPLPIFLMAMIAFNGGQIVLQAFWLNPGGMLAEGGFSSRQLVDTVAYISIGLTAFHCAAAIASRSYRGKISRALLKIPQDILLTSMQLVGGGMVLASFPFWFISQTNKLRISLSGRYADLYQQDLAIGADNLLGIIGGFLVPGIIICAVGFRSHQRVIIILTVIMIGITVSNFALGYRANSAWPLLAYLWVIDTSVRRIPRWIIATGATFLLIVVFPVIQFTRNNEGRSRVGISGLYEAFSSIDNPLISIIHEMGGSAITVAYTMDLVPRIRDYDHGWGYLYALTSAVPNIFTDGVHPAIAHGLPSHWLIWQVDPWVAERGGGLGFSIIAEAYYNFGSVGGVVALAVIGFLIATLFKWLSISYGVLGVAVAGIALAYFSHYARGEFQSIVRPLVWYAIVPTMITITLAKSLWVRSGRRFQAFNNRDGCVVEIK